MRVRCHGVCSCPTANWLQRLHSAHCFSPRLRAVAAGLPPVLCPFM